MTDTLIGGYFDGAPVPPFNPQHGVLRMAIPRTWSQVMHTIATNPDMTLDKFEEEHYVHQQVGHRYPHPCTRWISVVKTMNVMVKHGMKLEPQMAALILESDRNYQLTWITDHRWIANILNQVADLPRQQ